MSEGPRDGRRATGKAQYFRLKGELSGVCGSLPWNTTRIDQLANELAAIERWISSIKLEGEPRRPTGPGQSAGSSQSRNW